MNGVNEEHLGRAWSITDGLAGLVGGYDKLFPRGRGRPREPVKPKPLKQARMTDRRILDEIRSRSLKLKHCAIMRGQDLDPRRLRQIERAARRAALDSAEKRGELMPGADPTTDPKRIARWRKRDIKQLQQKLADALLGAAKPQKRTRNGEK
jgi:hypothetical protein